MYMSCNNYAAKQKKKKVRERKLIFGQIDKNNYYCLFFLREGIYDFVVD